MRLVAIIVLFLSIIALVGTFTEMFYLMPPQYFVVIAIISAAIVFITRRPAD